MSRQGSPLQTSQYNGGGVLESLDTAGMKSRDARRVVDVKQIQLALELYFDAKVGYPQTVGWEAGLTNEGLIPQIPKDQLSGTSYGYQACGGGESEKTIETYCLTARLEDASNSALNADFDSPPTGCTCYAADPFYAVSP